LGDDLHAPLRWVGADEQGHGGGHQEGCPDALERASADQGGDVGCDAAEERAEQEHGDAAEEDAFAADSITGAPADDKQRSEHDGVRGDDPRQRGRARVGIGRLDVGEGDVHDRQVERCHERAEGGDDEYRMCAPPAGHGIGGTDRGRGGAAHDGTRTG
jgi:hypothetical protein